jgi:hypothetical protein
MFSSSSSDESEGAVPTTTGLSDRTPEKIVDHRGHNNTVQYLVKWKDYPESTNTWEDEDNLMITGFDLILEYTRNRMTRQQEDRIRNSETGVFAIVHAFRKEGKVHYRLLFEDGTMRDYPSDELQAIHPQELAVYLEDRIESQKRRNRGEK